MGLWGREGRMLMHLPWLAPSVLALVLALNVGLAGDASAFTSVEFQPLEAGQEWTYLSDNIFTETETVLPGTQLVNGVPTRVVETSGGPEDGDRAFYTNDTNGLRFHKLTTPDPDGFAVVFTPPVTTLPAAFEIGTTFWGIGSLEYTFTEFGTFPGSYSFESRVVGVGQVVVPAGTCQALRINTTLTLLLTVNDTPIVVSGTGTDWYGRNLGVVRSVGTVEGDSSSSKLVSTNLQLCGDVNHDGFVGTDDVTLFRNVLAGLAEFAPEGEAKCTVIDPPRDFDLLDVTVIRREVEGPLLAPGISQVCDAVRGEQIFSLDGDASNWSLNPSATSGTLSDDNSDFVEGTGSLVHTKPVNGSDGVWRNDLGGVDWQGKLIRVDVKISNAALIAPGGIRLLLSHTAGSWAPSDWSLWAVAQSGLTSGNWITLAFDLATAPQLVSGSGADLSQVRFIGLQSLDAGSGTIILKWDNIRSLP
jgi:hypothetical protein